MAESKDNTNTPAGRLREFAKWAQAEGLCISENDFERICSLNPKYIANNIKSGKGNMGTEMLSRVIRKFPELNLAWLCTGEGDMLLRENAINFGYKHAYHGAIMQIEALNLIIQTLTEDR